MARRQLSDRNEGSTTLGATRTRFSREGLASAVLTVVAFLCYDATLLPGIDLGDSASFQTGVGSLTLTPRHAYPLYHGVGGLFVWWLPGDHAYVVNLVSAVFGAIAVGVATLLAARLAESVVAGIAGGLFLAFSYTFWTQSITAEVYTLHLLMTGATLVALLAWAERPTVARLALFYALYALGFGNHLSMVLLLPGLAAFLLIRRRQGSADPLRPRLIALAVVIATLGALQYAWNFRGLWTELQPPESFAEALGKFWVDVTKADWRETLVMTVSASGLQTRPAMYWFDLRQQIGVPGVLLAVAGFAYLSFRWPSRAVLLFLLYAANLAFAWNYNVGDAYIFFLPAHYFVALCAGAGVGALVAFLSRISTRQVAAAAGVACLVYPVWRGYDTFPAVDRSRDNRAFKLLDELTSQPENAIFGVDSNWQVQNAFEYFMHEYRPGVPWFISDELEWLKWPRGRERFNAFLQANTDSGRKVIVTPRLYDRVRTPPTSQWQHGPPDAFRFSETVATIRRGSPYVLAVLRSDREFPLNRPALGRAWTELTTGTAFPDLKQYNVVVGRAGERPDLIETSDTPFRVSKTIVPFDIDIRMESWLPTDTIRRAGFGHVVVNHRHELTIERGISFKALGGGEPIYDSNVFAPIPRLPLLPEDTIAYP
jgi:hypothetical protein